MPGLDDGPATMDESVKMASILWRAGFSEVFCTPHRLRGAFEAGNDLVRRGVAALQERLDTLRIDLRLAPGREHYLDEFFPDSPEGPLTLGASGHLLIEVAPHLSSDFVTEACCRIRAEGSTPLIAHPERSPLFDPPRSPRDRVREWFDAQCSKFGTSRQGWGTVPESGDLHRPLNPLLDSLKEIGCQFQGNIGSFAGIYGGQVQRRAISFLEAGLYSRFGTDAHSPHLLEQWLTEGLSVVRRVVGSEAAGLRRETSLSVPGTDDKERNNQ